MGIKSKILGFWGIIKRHRLWYRDAKIWKKKLGKKELKEIPTGKKIVLMPHSDDEWIGCSQLLQKNADDVVVVNMDMRGGDTSQLHSLRKQEAETSALNVGYRIITIQDDKIEGLSTLLKFEEPPIVFLPFYFDWHEEHLEVMRIFYEAAKQSGYNAMVGMYQVSLPIPEKSINSGYVMGKSELRGKWNNLKKRYPSQRYLPFKRFLLNEYINGAISGTYALEAYVVCKFEAWVSNKEKFSLTIEERQDLKNNLQSINYVREKMSRLGNEVL